MPSTPIYGFPYETVNDPPHGPARRQALAEAVETTVKTVDDRVLALEANRPRGFVGEVKRTQVDSVPANTVTVMETVTANLVVNRRYKLTWDVVYDCAPAGGPFFPVFALKYQAGPTMTAAGSTLVKAKNIDAPGVGTSLTFIGTFIAPSSGPFTMGTTAYRQSGTLAVRYELATTERLFLVEDIGV